MANKYYIPQRTRNPVVAGADMLLKFSEMKNRQGQLDVARERTNLLGRRTEAEFGPTGTTGQGLAPRRVGAAERLNEIRTQEAERQKRLDPISEKNFGMDKVTMLEGPLKAAGLDKAYAPILDSMKGMAANPKFTNREVYLHYKSNWPQYQQAVVESLNKEATKPGITPAQRDQMLEQMKQIEEDKTGSILDQFMPGTALAISGEQQSGEPFETWQLPDGTTQNLRRGEVPPAGAVKHKSGGMIIESDGQGGFRMIQGAAASGTDIEPLSRRGKGTLENNLIQAQDSVARLEKIRTSLNKDFLNVGKRLTFLKTKWQQKLKGTSLEQIIGAADPEEIRSAEKYWTWRQDSIGNLNKEIKWLTGAAMNKTEVPRIMKEIPNPGLGIFDGDAPDEFETKLNNKLEQTKLYIARYIMMLRQDIIPERIKAMGDQNLLPSESQIRRAIDNYGNELSAQGFNDAEVVQRLNQHFYTVEGD